MQRKNFTVYETKLLLRLKKNVLNKLCSLCAQHLISSAALHEMVTPMLSCKNCKSQIKLSQVALTLNIWQGDYLFYCSFKWNQTITKLNKICFYLSKTQPFLIIYSEYHVVVQYFLYCYEKGNTLSITFQKSFAIVWYFPSSFYNQNSLLLMRNGIVTSEWKYMHLPIDCFCTLLVCDRIKNNGGHFFRFWQKCKKVILLLTEGNIHTSTWRLCALKRILCIPVSHALRLHACSAPLEYVISWIAWK